MRPVGPRLALCWVVAAAGGCGGDDVRGRPVATCDDDGRARFSSHVDADSQARVDALAGCKELPSSATIGGGDVTDLTPLGSLEVVSGFLNLGSNGQQTLETLAGLDNLHTVGVWLDVSNTLVSDLEPLAGLRSLGSVADPNEEPGQRGALEVSDNPRLVSIAALANVSGVRSLRVRENPMLTSLEGPIIESRAEYVFVRGDVTDLAALTGLEEAYDVRLEVASALDVDELSSLESVAQGFVLDAPALEDVTGLAGLQSVGDLRLRNLGAIDAAPLAGVAVGRNLELRGLRGTSLRFDGLEVLAESLVIHDVTGLDWNALPALESVGALSITDNASLTSVAPPSLTTVTGDLVIANNPQLPHDEAVAFAESLEIAGAVKIFGNEDSPPPLDPCPFVGDFVCDEPVLCASGTDADCNDDGG